MMPDTPAPSSSLRTRLRDATGDAHRQLDDAMAQLKLTDRRDYALFLRIQYAARIGVEAWLTRHAPSDLVPPPQCPAIATDLAAMGEPLPLEQPRFDQATDSDALGVAWVLAGSSLGNRAMLADLKKSGTGDLPTAFLGNADMAAFWHDFRPRIDDYADTADGAIRSAHRTFAHFSAIAAAYLPNGAQ
ncbi:biliverdin-producing heme oxygenase [Erythrobacter sp. LQ02-29]|uniref:biliverdin-producing heme oxygenase n=1 Tax=Erythrobacter sp. LQ02-29 TaxID=2920384 RepID=UPI001F4E0760|nr:biliverdin-producing heme oxygenase [Erythrobacter sp. LQ02-29]MCP9222197.1 biliverdin-producing heme oxygenase [Erythrobacter sp. LQ02-29]